MDNGTQNYKKIIILYHGHEGSSAILTYLRNFNGTNVDMFGFEPFEDYNFYDYKAEYIPLLISLLFKNNSNEFFKLYTSMKPKYDIPEFPKSNFCFKLRVSNMNNEIISVIKEYNAKVFILYRRDRLKHCISMMDPQLQFINATIINKKIYDVDMFKYIYHYVNKSNNEKDSISLKLQESDIKTKKIYYEDLLNDKDTFIKDILSFADIQFDKTQNVYYYHCIFKKVHPNNIEEFVENYQDIKIAYDKLTLNKDV